MLFIAISYIGGTQPLANTVYYISLVQIVNLSVAANKT